MAAKAPILPTSKTADAPHSCNCSGGRAKLDQSPKSGYAYIYEKVPDF
jgi:hypothetical protein